MEKTSVCVDTAVFWDSIQVSVCEHSLRQRTERNNPLSLLCSSLLQTIFLNRSVKNIIRILINDKRTVQFFQNICGAFHCLTIVVGDSNIQCLSASDNLCQSLHSLLQRSLRIHSVMIENIYIIQAKTFQALVKTGDQILTASPVSIRSRPHIIACLCADDQLISVCRKFLSQDFSKIFLRTSRLWAIVVCKVKMCNSIIKCCEAHLLHILINTGISEIMP